MVDEDQLERNFVSLSESVDRVCLAADRAGRRTGETTAGLIARIAGEYPDLLLACKAAEGLIAHSPGCNERYYGRDQTCNCGFYEAKKQLRAAIARAESHATSTLTGDKP